MKLIDLVGKGKWPERKSSVDLIPAQTSKDEIERKIANDVDSVRTGYNMALSELSALEVPLAERFDAEKVADYLYELRYGSLGRTPQEKQWDIKIAAALLQNLEKCGKE